MEGALGYINDAVNYTAGGFKLLRGQPLPDRLQEGGQTNSSTWSPLLGFGREANNPTPKNNMLPDLRGLPDRMKRLSEWVSEWVDCVAGVRKGIWARDRARGRREEGNPRVSLAFLARLQSSFPSLLNAARQAS